MISEKKIFASPFFKCCPLAPKEEQFADKWYVYQISDRNKRFKQIPGELHGINQTSTFEDKMDYASRLIAYLHKDYMDKRPTMLPIVEQGSKDPVVRPTIIDEKTGKQRKYMEDTLNDLRGAVSDNEAIREGTQGDYNSIINVFEHWTKENGVIEIMPDTGKRYLSYLKHELERRNKTINNHRNILKTYFDKLVEAGEVSLNPFDKTYILPNETIGTTYFDENEIVTLRTVISANDPQLWLACQFIFYCFLRPRREMRLLKIEDIDFGKNRIRIVPQNAKMRKHMQYVAIPNAFLPELLFLKKYPKEYYIFSRGGKPGTVPLGKNMLAYRHRKFVEACKLHNAYEKYMYCWKPTGVLQLWLLGLDLETIRRQTRHSSLDQLKQYMSRFGWDFSDTLINGFPDLNTLSMDTRIKRQLQYYIKATQDKLLLLNRADDELLRQLNDLALFIQKSILLMQPPPQLVIAS